MPPRMPPGPLARWADCFSPARAPAASFRPRMQICESMRLGAPISDRDRRRPPGPRVRFEPVCRLWGQQQRQDEGVDSAHDPVKGPGSRHRFGLSAHSPSMLETVTLRCYTLRCGNEDAVAATKSVVEQALFYRSLLEPWRRTPRWRPIGRKPLRGRRKFRGRVGPGARGKDGPGAGDLLSGRNNGVAEELTLKTNEITHKKSDYLEGTYAVHGIEEIMPPEEVVMVIDPFPAETREVRDHVGRRRGHDRDRRGGPRDLAAHDPHTAGRGIPNGARIVGRLEHPGSGGGRLGDRPGQGRAGEEDRQRVRRRLTARRFAE